MIAKIRAVSGLARRAAPDVAEAVRDELERTIAAGTTPEGEAWKPRQAGGRALVGVEKAVAVAVVGTRIYVRLAGHVARHHLGRARGGVERRILPVGKLPPRMADAVRRVLVQHFEDAVRGVAP